MATHPRFPDRFSPKDELDSLPGFEDLSYFRDGGDYGLVARQQHKQGDLHIRDYVEKDLFMFHFPHENREECYEKRPEKKHQEFVEVHPRVRIPNRLLRGPWRWKDAALLFWLLRGGAERSADHTWEVRISFRSLGVSAGVCTCFCFFLLLSFFSYSLSICQANLRDHSSQTRDSLIFSARRTSISPRSSFVFLLL